MAIAAYLAAKDFLGSPIVGIDRAPEWIDQVSLAAGVTETINVPSNVSFAVLKITGSGVVYAKPNGSGSPPTGDVGNGTAWDMLKANDSLRYVLRDLSTGTPITTIALQALSGTPTVTIAWYYRERQGTELTFPNADVFDFPLLVDNLPTGITFSRASVATDVIAGNLVQFGNNVPRISAFNGLLIEDSRTNSLRNSQAAGATVGTIGSGGALPTNWLVSSNAGLSTDVVASGTRNGFNYVMVRVYGTPNGTVYSLGFDAATQINAAQNDLWSASSYAALVAGSLTNISSIVSRVDERDASGVFIASSSTAFNLTSSLGRAAITRTLASASTGKVSSGIGIAVSIGLAVDVTLDIAAPQLELGAYETSYIPTSGAAVTRAAESCTATPALLSQIKSVFAEFRTITGRDTGTTVGQRSWQIDDGSTANRHTHLISNSTGAITGQTFVAAASQGGSNAGVIAAPNNTYRTVYCFDVNNLRAFVNGASGPVDNTAAMPTINLLRIGSSIGNGSLSGYIRQLKGYSVYLSDSQALQLAAA